MWQLIANKKQVEKSQSWYSQELKIIKSQKLPQIIWFPVLYTIEIL